MMRRWADGWGELSERVVMTVKLLPNTPATAGRDAGWPAERHAPHGRIAPERDAPWRPRSCGARPAGDGSADHGRLRRRRRPAAGCLLLGLALGAAPLAAGTLRYEPDANRIVVSGFAEEQPATLDDLLAADRAQGWRRVSRDPASDTVTVEAALWIGATNDWGTFFQIGRSNHPRETLVLRGDLVVTAPRSSRQRQDGRFEISNRLTLGDPDRPDIRPAVKIACSRWKEFAVRVLAAAAPATNRPMGEWFMFHGTLTAATPDAQHAYAGGIAMSHLGVNYRIADATFSWWAGDLFVITVAPCPGAPPEPERVLRGVTFEHGGIVRWLNFEDCVFRDLETALTQGGAVRCVFEANRNNWALHANHQGALLLDCTLGSAANPPRLPRTANTGLRGQGAYRHARDPRVAANPGVLDLVSLPVRVLDAQGRPVPDARVWLSCPADPDGPAVVRRLAVTGRDGQTPGAGSERALLRVRREWRPTDNPAAPEERTYAYRLRVEAPGLEEAVETSFSGAAELPGPLTLQPRR